MGVYADCPQEGSCPYRWRKRSGTEPEILGFRLSMGYLSGIDNQCALPVGIEAELDVEMESLVLLEAAVR